MGLQCTQQLYRTASVCAGPQPMSFSPCSSTTSTTTTCETMPYGALSQATSPESAVGPSITALQIASSDGGSAYGAYMQETQFVNLPCPCYLELLQRQAGLTAVTRAAVVDWMSATSGALGLCSDTLFLAVAVLDRYLSVALVPKADLAITACACLLLAAKFEQAVRPSIACFLSCLSSQATGSHLRAAEAAVLKALEYRLSSIMTPKAFLRQIIHQASKVRAVPFSVQFLASYLAELCLLEYRLLRALPSQVAGACFALAHVLLAEPLDQQLLLMASGYSLQDLTPVMTWAGALHSTLVAAAAAGKPCAVTCKYDAPSYYRVASAVPAISSTADVRLAGYQGQLDSLVAK